MRAALPFHIIFVVDAWTSELRKMHCWTTPELDCIKGLVRAFSVVTHLLKTMLLCDQLNTDC